MSGTTLKSENRRRDKRIIVFTQRHIRHEAAIIHAEMVNNKRDKAVTSSEKGIKRITPFQSTVTELIIEHC